MALRAAEAVLKVISALPFSFTWQKSICPAVEKAPFRSFQFSWGGTFVTRQVLFPPPLPPLPPPLPPELLLSHLPQLPPELSFQLLPPLPPPLLLFPPPPLPPPFFCP